MSNTTDNEYSRASTSQGSVTPKVDVTISDAPAQVSGANGEYTLHSTPLSGHTVPYYQGFTGDKLQMYIIYNETKKQWEINSSTSTNSETKSGVVAYIECNDSIEDIRTNLLSLVSGEKKWFVVDGLGNATADTRMVAMVHSPAEADAPTEADARGVASATASHPAVAVNTPESIEEMRNVYSSIDTQYKEIVANFTALDKTDASAIKNFDTELDTRINALKVAQEQLDEYKKAATTGARLQAEMNEANNTGYYTGGRSSSSSSSSSSKKNRKSHKSYHPEIGKTRKHHSNAEPKRVSFVHQA
jgi:hypothetical protein